MATEDIYVCAFILINFGNLYFYNSDELKFFSNRFQMRIPSAWFVARLNHTQLLGEVGTVKISSQSLFM